MSEIEKMYKLANVKAINIAECGSTYIPDSVEIDGKLYPPFTAEKQLELIIFLINRKYPLLFSLDEGKGKISRCALEIGLAGIVNKIWQSLTPEEKQQVKGILE